MLTLDYILLCCVNVGAVVHNAMLMKQSCIALDKNLVLLSVYLFDFIIEMSLNHTKKGAYKTLAT